MLTTYGNQIGEYFDFLSVVHTDNSETAMKPHVRWIGYVCKDTGGSSLIFVAHNRYGEDIKLAYSFYDQAWTLNSLSSKLIAYAGTSQQFILVKIGHVVQFQIQWDIDRAYADGEVIASVPDGYAPERTSNFHVFGTDGGYLGMLRVNTNKTINPVFGQLKAGTARGMFVYVSAN